MQAANADLFLAVGEERLPEIRLHSQATVNVDYAQDFRFYHAKQRIKHWCNVSWRNSRPHTKPLLNLS